MPVGAMLPVERGEVDFSTLLDDVEDEPGEVVVGSQSRRPGGSRKGWSRSPRRKLKAMAPYLFEALVSNIVAFEDGILWVPLLWDLELLIPLVHMCSDTSLIYAKVTIEWSPKET